MDADRAAAARSARQRIAWWQIGYILKQAGVQPLFITPDTCPGARLETNYERHIDINLDHVRSFPGSKIYSLSYHQQAQPEMADALRQARQRVAAWQRGLV